MNILLVAHYCDDINLSGNNRFNYLARLLSKEGHKLEIITTNFSHEKKERRKISDIKNLGYKVIFLNEPGYKKNVSISRIVSHNRLAKNLKKYLENKQDKPDVIYCAIPSISFSYEAAVYAKKNNIRFIIDVQDLWPEAFKMVLNKPPFTDLIYNPIEKKADFIYSQADEIIAVSQTYVDRALNVNEKCSKGYPIFLGTELEYFDKIKKIIDKNDIIEKKENEVLLAYIGTLGHSYDLIGVFKAMKKLKEKNLNYKFIVIGDGPLKEKFEKEVIELDVPVKFTGRLSYEKMVKYLCQCDIALNPIKKGSAASIINKVGDYAMAGMPVINTQESVEYRKLVEEYDMGINCENENTDELSEAIYRLIIDKELRINMGKNARKCAEERFDRGNTYKEILEIIEK